MPFGATNHNLKKSLFHGMLFLLNLPFHFKTMNLLPFIPLRQIFIPGVYPQTNLLPHHPVLLLKIHTLLFSRFNNSPLPPFLLPSLLHKYPLPLKSYPQKHNNFLYLVPSMYLNLSCILSMPLHHSYQ